MRNLLVLAALSLLLGISCRGEKEQASLRPATGGDAVRGRQLAEAYGCGACHAIPGIRQPGGQVAPPLDGFARRTFIAGQLPNTPENLVRWIRSPRSVEPGTAMPSLGLTDQQARDVAAYLYRLE